MNTKVIVALVIGMALFGLAGAATATNQIAQTTNTVGLMIGEENTVWQSSILKAKIIGECDDNVITQTLDRFAVAIGTGNDLTQEGKQVAIIKDGDDNLIDQRILQAGIAFGEGNYGFQYAKQVGVIKGSEEQTIDQAINQFQLAFGINEDAVCDCIPPPDWGTCDPCEMIEEGCYNDGTQEDTQIAIIVDGGCDGDGCKVDGVSVMDL